MLFHGGLGHVGENRIGTPKVHRKLREKDADLVST